MMIMVIMMLIAAKVVEGDRYYFESSDAVLLKIMVLMMWIKIHLKMIQINTFIMAVIIVYLNGTKRVTTFLTWPQKLSCYSS